MKGLNDGLLLPLDFGMVCIEPILKILEITDGGLFPLFPQFLL
jgi:hypothetical protein